MDTKRAHFRVQLFIGLFLALFFYTLIENYDSITFALSGAVISEEAFSHAQSAAYSFRIGLVILLSVYFLAVIVLQVLKTKYERLRQKRQGDSDPDVHAALESVQE